MVTKVDTVIAVAAVALFGFVLQTQQSDIGTSPFGTVGNIVWFVFAGVWLAIGHLVSAVTLFLTIIGIPFGLQHLKLASIALAPIGKTIVSKATAQSLRAF